MSLDKAIKHGKEKRKPYRRAKAVDSTCRNHGSCDYCRGNRTIKAKKAKAELDSKMEEFMFESNVEKEGYEPQA